MSPDPVSFLAEPPAVVGDPIPVPVADAAGALPPGWSRVRPGPGESVRIEPNRHFGLTGTAAPWLVTAGAQQAAAWDWIAALPLDPCCDAATGRVWMATGGVVLVLTTPTPEG